jgi:hypothetical protein
MLRGSPDPSLDLPLLEGHLQELRREAAQASTWYCRERYIDRGALEPFYILEFRSAPEDRGDDTLDEELFQTARPGLRFVSMTRAKSGSGHAYWQELGRNELIERLDRFLIMFREDYLQPPGARGELHAPRLKHELFPERRFLFELRSPNKRITGVGPKKYAGQGIGAIRGRVLDETGVPLAGALVELLIGPTTLCRETDAGGIFWFSRVPPGKRSLRVRGRQGCQLRITAEESFGNVQGWLLDPDGGPVEHTEVKLIAPDAEEFPAWANASGRFVTGPLPAFPYILRVPEHLLTVQTTLSLSDAALGGVLRTQSGMALPGQTVVLKQNGAEVTRSTTDEQGRFFFHGRQAGRYQLELPGQRFFLRQIPGEAVCGTLPDAASSTKVELLVNEVPLRTERTTRAGDYDFDDVVPGRHRVRADK